MRILDSLLALALPFDCLGCSAEGRLVCPRCLAAQAAAIPRCYRCQQPDTGWHTCGGCRANGAAALSVRSAYAYDGLVRDLLWRLKAGRAQAAAHEIADAMAGRLQLAGRLRHLPSMVQTRIVVTNVPTATSRVRQRGYDQASLIARHLAATTGLPYLPLLRRKGQRRQVGASRQERGYNLAQAYRPLHTANVRGTCVLLVDDVLTTGASIDAAAHVLLAAGARRVDGLTFAQA